MPTPKREGAPLQQITLTVPASNGLNTQASTEVLGPSWATTALNAVFDTAGRLAARQGWNNLTSTPMFAAPAISQIFELVRRDGSTQIISAAGHALWRDASVPTNISGSATVAADNWQFVNFFGNCVGFQQGQTPVIYNGSTTFSNLAATDGGTVPTGNCAIVHSGRIWACDSDQQTIRYSGLLDQTKWATGSGAGNIDMDSVWPQGQDVVVAMAFFNGSFIIFGKNKIIIYQDGSGSPLGINPATMVVTDSIVGVGCIARDSIQQVEGGDILFLSSSGVQSLRRLVIEKSNPMNNVSKHVRDYLNGLVAGVDPNSIRSIYSPEAAIYLLSLPTLSEAFAFSTISPLQDGAYRVTEWTGFTPSAGTRSLNGTLYAALPTIGGKIGSYSGYQDNSSNYSFNFVSGWMDFGEDLASYLKIFKSIACFFWVSSNADMQINWGFDFDSSLQSAPTTLTSAGASQWGQSQYNIDQWSGGIALKDITFPVSGSGQFMRVGAQANINGSAFAVQQLNLYVKIGRMAK